MSVTRLIVLAALASFGGTGLLRAAEVQPPAQSPNRAAVIRLSGEVDDYRRDMLFRRFTQAKAAGATTVIVEIDTYGGLVTSGLDISRFLRGQNAVHTIAFVDSKAISAGALIAMACDEIVMAPGAVTMEIAPIVRDYSGNMVALPTAERAKMQSPLIQDFQDSASKSAYAPVLADAMVKVETSVYLVRDSAGHDKVVDESEYKKLTESSEWQTPPGVRNPIDGPDTLLTVGPDIAARLGLSKGTATSGNDLAAHRGLSIIADFRRRGRQFY